MSIGFYRLGRLYSETFDGVPYECTLTGPLGVGRDDKAATIRLITLFHETSHLIHDLSLGTALNTDFLLDGAAEGVFKVLASLTAKGEVVCPLLDEKRLPTVKDNAAKEILKAVAELETLSRLPLEKEYRLDTSTLGADGLSKETTLTGTHLLEGIAAIKTLFALAERGIRTEGHLGNSSNAVTSSGSWGQLAIPLLKVDLKYLKSVVDELPLLPDALGPLYDLAPRLFDAVIGPVFLKGTNSSFAQALDKLCGGNAKVVRGTIRSWPDDVLVNGVRSLLDIGFLYLADIALHVPPMEFIGGLIGKGKNTPRDFEPVPRFIRAMSIVKQNGAFPPDRGRSPQDYYALLFDWVAERAHWPGYVETQGAWECKLRMFRDKLRREMSDGYRSRLLVERRKNPVGVLTRDAVWICADQMVPLVHLTPTGMKVIRIWVGRDEDQNVTEIYSMPLEWPIMPVWELMHVDTVPWKSLPDGPVPMAEAMELEMSRLNTFLHEIVMRSMCRALQSALLTEQSLECPWAEGGCCVAQPGCKTINYLGDIPRRECSLRKYVDRLEINPDRVRWK